MCDKMLWLLCGGKYKFLLRSAWIVLATATLIDISAIIAYWQFAPKSHDSKHSLKLSLLLLVAVLFLYFFAALLSCFIIIKLSPKKRRESTILNEVRTDNATRFVPFSESNLPYLDGIRQALPNNLPPQPPPHRNSRGPITNEIQCASNRRSNITENAALSSTRTWNSHIVDESNLNGRQMRRQRMGQAANLPAIVITGPEEPVPIYENLQLKPYQFSTRVQRTSSSTESADGEFQYRSTNLLRSHFRVPNIRCFSSAERSICHTKQDSVSGSNNSSNAPASSESESFSSDRSVVYQHYDAEGHTSNLRKPNQNKFNSRSARKSISVEPVSSRSDSSISSYNASHIQTLDISRHQAKFDARVNNFNLPKPVSENYLRGCKQHFDERQTLGIPLQNTNSIKAIDSHSYVSLEPEVHRGLPSKHTRVTRSTDSFIAKSEPIVNQYKRYAVSKLPSNVSRETQLLFKAIEKTDDLFCHQSKERSDGNVPKTDDTLKSVLVLV